MIPTGQPKKFNNFNIFTSNFNISVIETCKRLDGGNSKSQKVEKNTYSTICLYGHSF